MTVEDEPSIRDIYSSTLDDVAAQVGRSRGTVKNWRSSGKLDVPVLKVGHELRFNPQDVEEWLKKHITK